MDGWTSFERGLLGAFSWTDGQDNVLVGGAPSWTYVLGLVLHFVLATALILLILIGIIHRKKQLGSWSSIWQLFRRELFKKSKIGGLLGLIMMPFIVIGFPAYEGYRIANGIWRYQYFTSQEMHSQLMKLVDVDTSIGGSKSTYSRVTLTVETESGTRLLHISNSTKNLARYMRTEVELPFQLEVQARKDGTVVFVV